MVQVKIPLPTPEKRTHSKTNVSKISLNKTLTLERRIVVNQHYLPIP
jgi:hypothetical protein